MSEVHMHTVDKRWQPVCAKFGRILACLACALCLAAMIAACDQTRSRPRIYFSDEYFWQAPSQQSDYSIPLTARDSGQTLHVDVHLRVGLGIPLEANDPYAAAVANAQRVLSVVQQHMTQSGWIALYSPVDTGAFPGYSRYITFRFGSFYCFVEYGATQLDDRHASQQLAIAYT